MAGKTDNAELSSNALSLAYEAATAADRDAAFRLLERNASRRSSTLEQQADDRHTAAVTRALAVESYHPSSGRRRGRARRDFDGASLQSSQVEEEDGL